MLHLLADQTDRGVAITDSSFRILYANRSFRDFLDPAADEMVGKDLRSLPLSPTSRDSTWGRIEKCIAERRDFAENVRLCSRSGKDILVTANITPVFDPKGSELEHVVAVLADVSRTRLVEDLQREVLAELAADSPLDEIMDLLCRRVESLSPGVQCSVITVTEDRCLKVVAGPQLPASYTEKVNGLPVGPTCGSCGTAIHRGEPVMVEDLFTSPLWADFDLSSVPAGISGCWSIPIKLRTGKVAGTFAFYFSSEHRPTSWLESIVSACSDLCAIALERFETKSRIARLASIDTLTGLPNRSQIIDTLCDAIAAARELDEPLAVLFVDIDHFKDVNDTLGHSSGDHILVETARRLTVQLREGDTVGRAGGDEFVVLLRACGIEDAARIGRRLLEYLSTPIETKNLNLTMSSSIGIAMFGDHGADAETLLKHADTAMHEAKREGPGRFRFFTEDLNRRSHDRLVLSIALREAIQAKKLRLVYQPQVWLTTGALHGVEALARWRDPIYGDVPAPRFISLAEEYGFIDLIDRWGVEEACGQIAAWRAAGVAVPHVSVNFSPLSFRNGDIVDMIVETLHHYGLQPSDLRVEITERVMMDQHPNSFATARAIEALGVRIAMDDFGTGYSSLSALSRLPIAELKLDRSFMLSIEQDENARALSTAVIRIGHSLGMTVVAEGVETKEQVDLLRALGCHAAQGYHFARPLTPDDLSTWLAGRPEEQPNDA
ncbi:EAL domain-containing protein [Xanthobacter autotrophicus DSM 431]|uniref:sensor domain-containing protein n=1 Tax=Xanthobacter nonsaccharivorans TaxID=3119912 RepID=UPI00372B38BF